MRSVYSFFSFLVLSVMTAQLVFAVGTPATKPTVGTTPQAGAKQLGPEFMQWCQQFVNQYANTGAPCKLACQTKNSGAQVCGPVASQFGSQGCHNNNRTAIFPSNVQGIGAHVALLRIYCSKQKRCTLGKVTQKWAEGTNGQEDNAYARTVAKWLNMSPNQIFDPNNIDQMGRIAIGMSRLEVGSIKYSCQDLVQGTHMAFGLTPVVAGPANIGTLVEGTQGGAQLYQSLFNQNQGFGDPFNQNGTNPFSSLSGQNGAFAPTNSSSQQTAQQPQQQQPQQQPQYPAQQSPYISPQPSLVNSFSPTSTSETLPEDVEVSDSAISEIACKPNTVAWVCNEGSVSRGISKPNDALFTTKGALIGSLYVNPKEKTTYTIQCIKNQKILDSASCALSPHKRVAPPVTVRKPQIAFEADPSEVNRGERTTLTWAALKVDSCSISGYGVSADGVEGSVETDELFERGRSEYTIECQDNTGEIVTKTIYVEVQ
ncbi:MAG: hypothetical protein WAY88_01165 [Minisyncoccia bacterium]